MKVFEIDAYFRKTLKYYVTIKTEGKKSFVHDNSKAFLSALDVSIAKLKKIGASAEEIKFHEEVKARSAAKIEGYKEFLANKIVDQKGEEALKEEAPKKLSKKQILQKIKDEDFQ